MSISGAAPLATDPNGGEVEPNLIPELAPTPARIGLYGDHGDRETAHLTEQAEKANLAALNRKVYDGLAQLEIAVRNLNKRRLILGPYVWTPADSLIRVEMPADRLPVNAVLHRFVAILSATSGAAETLVVTDLLPIAFQVTPSAALASGITDDAGMTVDIPLKTEGFNITKQAGGNFVSTGVLYLDIREIDLV